jgi:parallel beta-helix repeat protein
MDMLKRFYRKTPAIMMLFWFLAGTLITAFPVLTSQAAGNTIYIRADGSIDPPSAPIQRVDEVYTLTFNINESIVIERDDIVIDGAGYILQGESATGLSLSQRKNVTVKNFRIVGFLVGIELKYSNNCIISYNTITNNGYYGIWLQYSNNNTIAADTTANNDYGVYIQGSGDNILSNNIATNNAQWAIYLENSINNTISRNIAQYNENGFAAYYSDSSTIVDNIATNNSENGMKLHHSNGVTLSHNTAKDNGYYGIYLDSSGNCTLSGNTMSGNKYNFGVEGVASSGFENNLEFLTNVADGKPIYYVKNMENMVFDSSTNAATVYIINSKNMTIRNLNLTRNVHGVFFWNTQDSLIEDVVASNNVYGLLLNNSDHNHVWHNQVSNNSYGIFLENCDLINSVFNNTVTDNAYDGIRLISSNNTGINDNSVLFNSNGIVLEKSSFNVIVGAWSEVGNLVANNSAHGIYLESSNGNEIFWNTAVNNTQYGIYLGSSDNNWIMDNTASDNYGGIRLDGSHNNTVSDNTASDNKGWAGIWFYESPNSTVLLNRVVNNKKGIGLSGCEGSRVSGNIMSGNQHNFQVLPSGGWPPTSSGLDLIIDSNNIADGKQIYYMKNTENIVIDSSANAATVYILNSKNITVKDVSLCNNGQGICAINSTNIAIQAVNMNSNNYGIQFWNTNSSKIENVTATHNYWSGIELEYSSDITISECTLANNTWQGISLKNSRNITISDNIIKNNANYGVLLHYGSSSNCLSNNIIMNNGDGFWLDTGIYLVGTTDNLLFNNSIANNLPNGIVLTSNSYNNTFFHNNFANNQIYCTGVATWDNGVEGNYWSDYTGNDLDGNGIGDTPYEINENNHDQYPLIEPWSTLRTFSITWGAKSYDVCTFGNSTIASVTFDQTQRQISFKTTGQSGTIGFCNVTIAKELLDAPLTLWNITVDGEVVDAAATENMTHTFIYFTFTHSTKTIVVKGTNPIDNTPPVANAGLNQTVNEDTIVNLNGSASTDNIEIANYTWTFVDEAPQKLTEASPAYNFTTPGTYLITLNVTDLRGNWNTNRTTIVVLDKKSPIAEAGSESTIEEGTVLTFDGSESTDNVAPTNYTWNFVDGTTKTLKGKNAPYLFQTPGTYTVTLNVTDAAGNWATDTVTITVTAAPIWTKWWFWPVISLITVTSVSFPFGMKYYQNFKKQRELLVEYESELETLPINHLDRARARFIKDLIKRKEKIDKFAGKWGIKLRPGSTLEDVAKKLGIEIKQ